jgi:hypothetical protein
MLFKSKANKEDPRWFGYKIFEPGSYRFFGHTHHTESEIGFYTNDRESQRLGGGFTINGDESWFHLWFSLCWFTIHLTITIHPLTTWWYKHISKSPRMFELELSNTALRTAFMYIDNDYASEYRWLKRRNVDPDKIPKILQRRWFKLFWRLRKGFQYNIYKDSLTGYQEFIPVVGLIRTFKIDFAMDDYAFRVITTMEAGHLRYNKAFGRWLYRKTEPKETFFKINFAVDTTEPHKVPMRHGKGENSWDCAPEYCVGDTYCGVYKSEMLETVTASTMPHALRNPLDSTSEAFIRHKVWEQIQTGWRKYGKCEEAK